ncbi:MULTISPECIES: addiction module antidote protein [Brevundimonas]|uniref:addiction module antidote protein n=1 Tax=Brevundimonas sp. TaxID=1871086 RepID=UPI0028B08E26|nr:MULTISPECIES: addiction module antidote protein [Brevundimonas]
MADLGIREFDPAEVLTSAERIAAYIQVVADDTDNDAGEIIRAFRVAVRARGASIVAADAGLSELALHEALADGADPSFATVLNIARSVGVRVSFQSTN